MGIRTNPECRTFYTTNKTPVSPLDRLKKEWELLQLKRDLRGPHQRETLITGKPWIWGVSKNTILSAQFSWKPKTALKNKAYLKKKVNQRYGRYKIYPNHTSRDENYDV